tara:strand:- start:135 stop:554 length:420 start_codon:yes stop_codon:yes gene_type:complete
MKISKKDKIEECFLEIKSDSIFKALKANKFTGIKRGEIESLLNKYSLNQVYNYLRTRYRKRNYLLIYGLLFSAMLVLLASIGAFHYFYNQEFFYLKYISMDYYNTATNIDFVVLSIALTAVFLLLFFLREIIIFFKRLK